MKPFTVLHVDDDKTIGKIVALVLERFAGWKVEFVASGEEAFKFLLKKQPDLVLLDIMMPNMDGTAAFKRMQKAGLLEDIPVIFLSAKVLNGKADEYLAMGAAGVIQKPFDPACLPELIQEIVDNYLGAQT